MNTTTPRFNAIDWSDSSPYERRGEYVSDNGYIACVENIWQGEDDYETWETLQSLPTGTHGNLCG
jgi:hypothetical protein